MFRFLHKEQSFLPSLSWKDILLLVVGVSAFVAIAASTVTKFSIWFDESFGSYMVRFDFGAIARYTADDVHPPLYYWLLKIWTTLFGNTELGLRTMSIFFGAVTVVFAFLLAYRLFGRRVAYRTLLFLAISPLLIRYSQEARMYTLLSAEVLAATYMLAHASSSKKLWPWVTYGVIVALGMLTQYFAALAWIAHWVWRFWTVRKKGDSFKVSVRKVCSREWLIAYGVAVLLFLPWLPFMAKQFFVVQGFGFWISPVTVATIPSFLTDVVAFNDTTGTKSWLALGFYLSIIFVGYVTYRLLRALKGADRNHFVLLLTIITVPTVLLVLISLPPLRSAFVDRYLLPVAVFIAILFAIVVARTESGVSKRIRMLSAGLLVIVSVVGVMTQAELGNYNRSSSTANVTRNVVELARAVDPKVPIIANTPWLFYEAVVYTQSSSPVYFVNETTKYNYGSLTMLNNDDTFKIKDLDAFTATNANFWVIGKADGDGVQPLRSSWHKVTSVTVNDYVTGKPTTQAVLFSAE